MCSIAIGIVNRAATLASDSASALSSFTSCTSSTSPLIINVGNHTTPLPSISSNEPGVPLSMPAMLLLRLVDH